MLWVIIFGSIAVAGLAMVAAYAVWLWHKASDLFSEVEVLADRGEQLASLLAEIKVPDSFGMTDPYDEDWDHDLVVPGRAVGAGR